MKSHDELIKLVRNDITTMQLKIKDLINQEQSLIKSHAKKWLTQVVHDNIIRNQGRLSELYYILSVLSD